MAGHSKWKNIQHRKGAQDKRRGKLFTKLIREITAASRMAGNDPNANPRLRTAIDKAFSYNMPKDTIERAVKRGGGSSDDAALMEIRYEGYGPKGVAVMVDCLTDNKNRTVAEVRHAFTKCGGQLGTDGSVAYLFNQVGLISFKDKSNEEKIMEIALQIDANDIITNDDGTIDVITEPDQFAASKKAIEEAGLPIVGADITMIPATEVDIDSEEDASKLIKLSDMLEDLDDVQNVYTNANISEELLEKL